jgi:hypothetical protein
MDHQTTGTTLRTSKKPTSDLDIEELELDSFIEKSKPDVKKEIEQVQSQTLSKRDYGNFALLVILCKCSLI